jgi:hypothetical protein
VGNPEGFLKFNDNHVSPADSVEDECFGGERTPAQVAALGPSKYAGHEKNWNAYLLFYERVGAAGDAGDARLPAADEAGAAAAAAQAVAGAEATRLGAAMRAAQALEVVQSNAALWRRKLVYQKPVLDLMQALLRDASTHEGRPNARLAAAAAAAATMRRRATNSRAAAWPCSCTPRCTAPKWWPTPPPSGTGRRSSPPPPPLPSWTRPAAWRSCRAWRTGKPSSRQPRTPSRSAPRNRRRRWCR